MILVFLSLEFFGILQILAIVSNKCDYFSIMITKQVFQNNIQFKFVFVSFQGHDEFSDDVDSECKSKILLKFSFIAQTVSQLKVKLDSVLMLAGWQNTKAKVESDL